MEGEWKGRKEEDWKELECNGRRRVKRDIND
jgi:hypothetical protein